MQIRPKIILTNGRVQQPVRVQTGDVFVDPNNSFLVSDTASSLSTLTVKNIYGFAIDQILLLGAPGGQGSEIVKTNHTTAPTSAGVITLVSCTSTTSLAIGTGSTTFTTQSGVSIVVGDRMRASSDASSANYMEGTVTSYSTTTLIINVDTVGGSGTKTDWTIRQVTKLPHSASTQVSVIPYDQIEFSIAPTVSGSKSVLSTPVIAVDQFYTEYNDTSNTTGYYFGRFKTSIGGTFSSYSDPAPYEGYGLLSARAVIDAALGAINKKTSEVLSDVFAFTEIDNCQTEVIRELKRWSFMQKFDQIIGNVTTGSWKVALPTDLQDQNTNGSIYTIRVGKEPEMQWVDKEKFDEFLLDVGYTTLASNLIVAATTMVLTNSSDFGDSGTAMIGANTYTYTANNTSTGTLTLSTTITSSNTATAGADVFIGMTLGLPWIYTVYGGELFYLPATASTYNNQNLYMDYYSKQLRITSDYDNLVVPDPMVVIDYLCWKFLKKLNNGEETAGSSSYAQQYLARREKMKQKETMNRTFKFKARFQNFAVQSSINSETPRWIRDGNFPNTGF